MSRPVATDVLIVAAHPPELSGLSPLLGDALKAQLHDLDVVAEAIGIGLAAAAAGMAIAVATHGPRCVVMVGTCGVYANRAADLGIGQVVAAHRVRLASSATVEGRAAFPGPMLVGVDPDASLTDGLAGESVRRVGVATTLAITTEDALAHRISGTLECEVEHLEAFSAIAACVRLHVPSAVVLGVANRVGSPARDEWLRHHEEAGKAATDVVAAWLGRGAPGLVRT
jgi:futalosine hydrolase